MRRFILTGVLLAAMGGLATGVAGAQSTLPPRTEIEPNNSIAQPDPVPVLSDTAIRGSIALLGDRDFFRVVVSQQASVRFETWVPDRPDCVFAAGLVSNDTFIRLFDATGQELAAHDDHVPGVDRCSLLVRTLSPGTYFISVEEFFNNQVIPAYTLEIDFTPDQAPCPADDDDDEDEDDDDGCPDEDGDDDDQDDEDDDDDEEEDDD